MRTERRSITLTLLEWQRSRRAAFKRAQQEAGEGSSSDEEGLDAGDANGFGVVAAGDLEAGAEAAGAVGAEDDDDRSIGLSEMGIGSDDWEDEFEVGDCKTG